VGLGGVASKPWRARNVERALIGAPPTAQTFRHGARTELTEVWTVPGTEFKVELGRRTLERALQTVAGVAP
jgi:xanthine dehydrogenase YagS FAD-binding subunit